MKVKKILVGLLLLTLAFAACQKTDTMSYTSSSSSSGTGTSNPDADFMKAAASANFDEIDAGQLASTKASDASVKAFGQMMVSDHTKFEAALDTLAKSKQVTLPAGPDQAHIDLNQRLMKLSGRAFDSTYIHAQVTDHRGAVELFQNEINHGKDSTVKGYARRYFSIIQVHLNKADSIAQKF
jgi:putative membrane protein